MSDKKQKQQYQYQIDDQDDVQQEMEMQQSTKDEQGSQPFQEKQNTSHSTSSSKKKRGSSRLKAKKPVSSSSQIETKDSALEIKSNSKSAVFNQQDSSLKKVEKPFIFDFLNITIKKDVNYSSFEKTIVNYSKGQQLQMSEQSFYKVKKFPKQRRGFFEFLTQNAQRYIFIEKGTFYTLRKIKDEIFIVQSVKELGTLFKIYEDKSQTTKLILCFINKERNPNIAPNTKEYYFPSATKREEFLQAIEKTLQLQGFNVIK